MRTSTLATFSLCILLAAGGCTTVSTHTSVASQAGAPAVGPSTAVRAPAQAPAVQGALLPIDKWTTTLVMARAVPNLGEVREIADRFNSKIVSLSTLH